MNRPIRHHSGSSVSANQTAAVSLIPANIRSLPSPPPLSALFLLLCFFSRRCPPGVTKNAASAPPSRVPRTSLFLSAWFSPQVSNTPHNSTHAPPYFLLPRDRNRRGQVYPQTLHARSRKKKINDGFPPHARNRWWNFMTCAEDARASTSPP